MFKINSVEIPFKEFPNGETIFPYEIFKDILHSDKPNEVLFKYENDSDLLKLIFIKKYIDSKVGKNEIINLTITQMPYGRMDRIEGDSAFTLKYVTDLINDLKFDKVTVVEPHSNVTNALLNRSESVFVNFDLLSDVMKEVGFDINEDFIMFPDLGASKRYSDMKLKNVIIGDKKRDFTTGKIEGLNLNFNGDGSGAKVIIVDDLSSYGGTFIHSSKALVKEGFDEVYLLVAHAENSIFKGELFSYVNKVFTTNSLLTDHTNEEIEEQFENRLKVYDIEGVLKNEKN